MEKRSCISPLCLAALPEDRAAELLRRPGAASAWLYRRAESKTMKVYGHSDYDVTLVDIELVQFYGAP